MSKTPTPAKGKPEKFVWKVTINAPIETVWNTLVKTDEVLPFFFGAVCPDAGWPQARSQDAHGLGRWKIRGRLRRGEGV